jgi:hypothetical protein
MKIANPYNNLNIQNSQNRQLALIVINYQMDLKFIMIKIVKSNHKVNNHKILITMIKFIDLKDH